MALVGIELVTHVSEPDALTTRPPYNQSLKKNLKLTMLDLFPVYFIVQ